MKTFWIAVDKDDDNEVSYIFTSEPTKDSIGIFDSSKGISEYFGMGHEKYFGLKIKPGQKVKCRLEVIKCQKK